MEAQLQRGLFGLQRPGSVEVSSVVRGRETEIKGTILTNCKTLTGELKRKKERKKTRVWGAASEALSFFFFNFQRGPLKLLPRPEQDCQLVVSLAGG